MRLTHFPPVQFIAPEKRGEKKQPPISEAEISCYRLLFGQRERSYWHIIFPVTSSRPTLSVVVAFVSVLFVFVAVFSSPAPVLLKRLGSAGLAPVHCAESLPCIPGRSLTAHLRDGFDNSRKRPQRKDEGRRVLLANCFILGRKRKER